MLRWHTKNNAQSIAEYSLFLTLVAAALLTMQVYMKRGFQGVLKFAADEVGSQEEEVAAENMIVPGSPEDSQFTTVRANSYRIYTNNGGASGRDIITNTSTASGKSITVELERDQENEEEPYGLVY